MTVDRLRLYKYRVRGLPGATVCAGELRRRDMARIKLQYWEKWGGHEWDTMAEIVRSFNASQRKYEVVMVEAGDWAASPDLPKFLRAHEQGVAPDLIGLEDHQIADLAAQKALAPLEQFMGTARLAGTGYRDSFLELGRCDGRLYGVPVSGDVVTLYVNLAAVQGTRLDGGCVPAQLWEFDACLDEMCGQGKVGFVPTYPGWWPQAWAWCFGGSWLDERGTFTPALPANIRSYEWVASLRCRCDPMEFAQPLNPIGARDPDPFLSGEVAMVFEGDWLVRRLLRAPGVDWKPAAFPTAMQKPSALIVADVLSIPLGCRHPEGAAEFMRFAAQPEQIERLALGHVKISPLRVWSERFVAEHQNPELGTLGAILATAHLFYDPRIAGWMGYLERIKRAFHLVWSEEETAARALTAIEDSA